MFMMWLLFGGQRINIPTRMIMGQISIELMPAENSVDRLQELRAFISVAEAGGFSAASRRSGEAQPAISKAIASLEKRLGVALFNRSTLTDQGQRYLDRTKPLLEELAYADNAR
jgi:hypothetical protein